MCCCGETSGSGGVFSRLGVTAGLGSLATLSAALLSSSWLHAREPLTLPGGQTTNITFRVGLWRVCPTLKRIVTSPGTLLASPGCQLIHYSGWREVREADLGIPWSTLEYTPSFVTKMRYATPLVGLALALIALATLFALLGHCHSDLKTLVACGLYTIGGLTLASGLVVFVSVLSDVATDHPRHSPSRLEYRYGWAFHGAGASCGLAEVAALLTVSAYLRRFPSVEAMVRAVVPGADRKLRLCVRGAVVGEVVATLHTPPDICTSKPPHSSLENLEERNSLESIPDTNVLGDLPNDIRDLIPPIPSAPACREHLKKPAHFRRPFNRDIRSSTLFLPKKGHHFPTSHPATLVLPEHDPFRYTTIIHQGLLGVAEGSSSSGSSSYSTHSLPRGFHRSSSPSTT